MVYDNISRRVGVHKCRSKQFLFAASYSGYRSEVTAVIPECTSRTHTIQSDTHLHFSYKNKTQEKKLVTGDYNLCNSMHVYSLTRNKQYCAEVERIVKSILPELCHMQSFKALNSMDAL